MLARRSRLAAGAAATVAALVLANVFLPRGLPPGVVLQGVVIGLVNALGAIGLILVYRAGNYVNFAHGGLGAAGAVLAFKLITLYDWNWFAGAALGIVVSVALAGLCEILFVQRLFSAPRLILTVATIGIAQFVAFFELGFSLIERKNRFSQDFSPPIPLDFRVPPLEFGSEHILVLLVVPTILAAFAVFFARSRYGAVVQAAAENADRARLLGVSVRGISTMTWLAIGLLSGITAVLQVPIVGLTFGAAAGPALLIRALAPAMIAGFERLPTAVVASLALGVLEQAVAYNVPMSGPIELLLFVFIAVALFFRRRSRGRTTEGEERSFAVATTVRPFPRQLARVPVLALGRNAVRLGLLAAAVLAPVAMSISNRNLAGVVVISMIAALSLTVLTGYAGQVSFGQWAFVGFGALFGGWLVTAQGMPFWLGLVVVPLAGSLVALLIGLPALRIRGIFLGVTTLAFAVAAHAFIFQLPIFGISGLVTRPTLLDSELSYYYACLACLLVVMLAIRNLRNSALGRAMVAVRDNDRAAASYGIQTITAKLTAFAVSGFVASLAGYLLLFNAGRLDIGQFPPLISLLLFSAVVIGGLGSQSGAIIAALYFRGVSLFLPGYVQFLTTSLGLLLILLFLPGGLGSLLFGARDALLRRYARAKGIRVPSLVADTLVVTPAAGPADSVTVVDTQPLPVVEAVTR